jgi:predicted O-methyltransferase YrrM
MLPHLSQVADPDPLDKAAMALAEFNQKLFEDERIDLSIIPVGDGMAMARKR